MKHETDIRGLALAEVPSYVRASAEGRAVVSGIAAMCQAFEDSAESLRTGVQFTLASGAALDMWGRIIGEPRGLLKDATYRRFILARALAHDSSGTAEDLSRVLRLALPDLSLTVEELPPLEASITIITDDAPNLQMLERTRTLIRDTLGAAVRFRGVWAVRPAFGTDSNTDPNLGPLDVGLLAYEF